MLVQALYGDCTLDGTVNGTDLAKVLADWGKTGQTWTQGDFNYDGVVNGTDLAKLLANWGKSMPTGIVIDGAAYPNLDSGAISMLRGAGITVVPEPGTLALLAAGLIGLLAYAWRKRK